MKKIKLTTDIEELSISELSATDRSLVEAAMNATRSSMAPYSRFHVGAAILLANGAVVTGSNQENAAYMCGTCAERSACFYAGAQYPGEGFAKIAIAAWTSEGKPEDLSWEEYFQEDPISPCGLCRQALLEYENKQKRPIELLLYGRGKVYRVPSVASLLPLSFVEF